MFTGNSKPQQNYPLHILESHLLVLTQVSLLQNYYIFITKTKKTKTYIKKTPNVVLALANAGRL